MRDEPCEKCGGDGRDRQLPGIYRCLACGGTGHATNDEGLRGALARVRDELDAYKASHALQVAGLNAALADSAVLRSRLTEAERLLKAWRGGGFPRAETDAFLASPTSPTERAEPRAALRTCARCGCWVPDGQDTCRCNHCKRHPTPPKGTAP